MDQPHDPAVVERVASAISVAFVGGLDLTPAHLAVMALDAVRLAALRAIEAQPVRRAHVRVSPELLEELLLLPHKVRITHVETDTDDRFGNRPDIVVHVHELPSSSYFLQPCEDSRRQVVTPIIHREASGAIRIERFEGEVL